jgi:HPt (histidine-containing phosphotransfer) domain-containing protein
MAEEKWDEKIKVYVPEYAIKLIPNFIKNREKDIKNIEDSLQKKDFEIIERIGHSMKGSGAIYGFDRLSEVGKLLEESAKKKNLAEIKNNLEELKNYMGRIEIVHE